MKMKIVAMTILLATLLAACAGEATTEIPAATSNANLATVAPTNTPMPATVAPTLLPTAIEVPEGEAILLPTPGKLDGLILSSADLGGQGEGANLTPAEGCQGLPCALRLWLVPSLQEGAEPNLLTIAVIEHPDAATAQASAAQKQADFLQDGYTQLSLPADLSLPPGSYALSQGDQALLLTFTQDVYEVTLILESQSGVLDSASVLQILAAYADIQLKKLVAGS